jgi:hypothetical protein
MEKRLACGLLCEYELNYSESTHMILIVKQGANSDNNLPGVAHFLEHMLMEIREDIWMTDLSIKGTTSFEYTKYQLSFQSNYMEFINALSIVKGIVFGEFLNPYFLQKVRIDILKEYNAMLQDNAFKIESDLIRRIALSDSMPIGNEESILKISYADILKSFHSGYKLQNMKLCIVGGDREWEDVIDDVFDLSGKISSRIKLIKGNILARNDRYHNHFRDLNNQICFMKIFDTNSPYMDLIENMSLTILEEMIKKKLNIIEDLIIVEVIQYVKKVRFIRICIKNIDIKIKDILNSVYEKIVSRSQSIKLLYDDIKKQYCVGLKQEEYGYLYIQHLADCYIYNKKSYKNKELLEYIYHKNVFDSIIDYLENLLNDDSLETYSYLISGGNVYYEK